MTSETADSKPGNLNLPNALTVLRLVLVPVFLVLLLGHGALDPAGRDAPDAGLDPVWMLWAFVVFAVAMITDWIDGTLARRWNIITDFGKIADPIADKALMASALIGLWLVGLLPWWVPVVILIRELGITVLRFVIIRWVVLPASKGGKLKTVLQTAALSLFLLVVPVAAWFPSIVAGWLVVSWVLLTAAIVVTLVTGADYCVKSYNLVREAQAGGRGR